MGNFGIGIGSFTNGLMQGLQMGKAMREYWQQEGVRDEVRKAFDDASKSPQGDAGSSSAKPVEGVFSSGADAQAMRDAGSAMNQTPESVMAAPGGIMSYRPQSLSAGGGMFASPGGGQEAPSTQPAAAPATEAPLSLGQQQSPAGQSAIMRFGAPTYPRSQQPGAPEQQILVSAQAPDNTGGNALPQAQSTNTSLVAKQEEAYDPRMGDYMKNLRTQFVPKVAQIYMREGSPEKAQAWLDWAENSESRDHMRTWAKAMRASSVGDVEGMANHIMKLYNSYDDGVTALSKEAIKDSNGNITGFKVKLRDDATGQEREANIDRNTLLQQGLTSLTPSHMFEATWKAHEAGLKSTRDAQAKIAEEVLKGKIDIAKQAHKGDIDRANKTAELTQTNQNHLDWIDRSGEVRADMAGKEVEAKAKILRDAGYTEDEVTNMLPQIVGGSTYRKPQSPAEVKRMILLKYLDDPVFRMKKPHEQQKIVDEQAAMIIGTPPQKAAPAGPAATPSGAPQAPKGMKPFLDTKTGKVVYLPAQ